MNDPAADIQTLLRTLVEQQTALLSAHAESVRMQRLLVERLLGAATAPALSVEVAATVVAPGPTPVREPGEATIQTVQMPAPNEPPPVVEHVAEVIASVPETQQTVDPAPAPASAPGERPPLRVVGGTAMRSDRYYQSTQAPRPASARPISLEGLDVLRRIQAAGEVAHLILTFGPHAGETLGQVAQSDPDYVRRLALTAQRPDVRAAAATLLGALPASPPTHGRRTPQRSRRGAWRGAS
jgi:hypothetical protein